MRRGLSGLSGLSGLTVLPVLPVLSAETGNILEYRLLKTVQIYFVITTTYYSKIEINNHSTFSIQR